MMLLLKDIDEINIYPTTDTTLRAYSHSMLNSISTCPTYGLVTYVGNKAMSSGNRSLALEAGSASHECYAAARLWQVGMHQGLTAHMDYHGVRLFGADKYKSMQLAQLDAADDPRNAMLRFCLEAFYAYGYYDDPSDKRRTFSNIEEALIAYLDRVDMRRDVWVKDKDDPKSDIGIEIPLDITIEFRIPDEPGQRAGHRNMTLRFIGTADGVTIEKDDALRLEENKTASRLGDAWAMAWHTSHQQTGYMLSLQTTLGVPVTKAAVIGMAIPLPRSYDAGGLMTEVVSRTDQQYQDFLGWILHSVQMIDLYGDNPTMAPKFTGSCNKYFRACSLVPLCASDAEDRADYYEQMVARDLSPTEQAMDSGDE